MEQLTLDILRDKGIMEMKPFTFLIINQLFLFTMSMYYFKNHNKIFIKRILKRHKTIHFLEMFESRSISGFKILHFLSLKFHN